MSVVQLVEQLHEEAVQLHEEEHVADLLALAKAEKIAMEEVRCGLVAYTPESSLAP